MCAAPTPRCFGKTSNSEKYQIPENYVRACYLIVRSVRQEKNRLLVDHSEITGTLYSRPFMATISAIDFNLPSALAEGGYSLEGSSSVWYPQARSVQSLYSDGDAAEERLFKTIDRSIDVRSGSSPLAAEIRDWAMEYHLSAVRTNLLRPLSHLLKGDTLEIGAGCGALSRYIGELDGRLLAVEGSLRRATIAAARCKSLDNTTVVCDNFESLRVNHRFDAIVVVGVLEYYRLFGGETVPVAFLRHCRRFLKPSGCLILAIENKLGLKYLCGAPEDHLGEPYFGVEDRYTDSTAITWGRSQLAASLRSAGWNHLQELFPFPDYKLPQLILTRNSLKYGSVVTDLLAQYGPASDTGTPFRRSFSEAAAWKVAVENNLVPDLANSFLMVASYSPLEEMTGAFVYSSNRHRAFQCETRIDMVRGELKVKKTSLYEDSRPSTAKFKWSPSASPFRQGRVYSSLLEPILLRPGWHYDELISWARPYYQHLLTRVLPRTNGLELCLSGDQLDCGPHNLSLRADGKLEDFDFEWIALHEIPLGYVFFRSLLHCLNHLTAVAPSASDNGLLNGLRTVMSAFHLSSDDQTLVDYLERESVLQSFVSGRKMEYRLDLLKLQQLRHRAPSLPELLRLRNDLTLAETNLAAERSHTQRLEEQLQRLQSEISQTKKLNLASAQQLSVEQNIRGGLEQSLSWRLTKPLRAANNAFKSLTPRFSRRHSV